LTRGQVYVCEVCGETLVGVPIVLDLGHCKITVCPRCARKIRAERMNKEEKKVIIRREERPPILERKKLPKVEKKVPTVRKSISLEEIDLVEGYGAVIRKARESLGLTVEHVAKALNVKASLIRHIEAEEIIPPVHVARGLEKLLDIRIIIRNPVESPDAYGSVSPTPVDFRKPTIGEMINIKVKKNKKE